MHIKFKKKYIRKRSNNNKTQKIVDLDEKVVYQNDQFLEYSWLQA